MLDMETISNTITELEDGGTNFNTCMKLASLYIIREHYTPPKEVVEASDSVTEELSDILPSYKSYCEIKTEYQLHKLDKDSVLYAMKSLGKEISDFLTTIYSSTDTEEERDILRNSILSAKFM